MDKSILFWTLFCYIDSHLCLYVSTRASTSEKLSSTELNAPVLTDTHRNHDSIERARRGIVEPERFDERAMIASISRPLYSVNRYSLL